MNTDDPVRAALDALAAADESRHARPWVKQAVLDAFDRQMAQHPGTVASTVQLVAAGAVVVVSVATAVFVYVSRGVPVRPSLPERRIESLVTARPTLAQPPAPEAVATVPGRRSSRARPATSIEVDAPRPPRSEAPQVRLARNADDFTQVVQARIPRSYLPLLGVPIIDPSADGTIDVEILLGEDGQARAIRVVR